MMEQGFNHNIEYRCVMFHVQTEDSGAPSLALRTHLFFEGQILTSHEGRYSEDSEPDCIQTLMKEQHKAMIAMLLAGEFDAVIGDAGISLIEHQWPVDVPPWLSKHPPPTFLRPKMEVRDIEQPDRSLMRATIDSCTEATYVEEEATDDPLSDVINAALVDD